MCTHLDDFILFWFLFYRFFQFFSSIFPMIFPRLFDRFHLQQQEGHNLAVPEAPLLQLFGAENVWNLRCVVECWGFRDGVVFNIQDVFMFFLRITISLHRFFSWTTF